MASDSTVLTGQDLVAAQKVVADAAVFTGKTIAEADAEAGAAFQKAKAGNDVQQRFYKTGQDIKYLLQNSVYPVAEEFSSKGTILGKPVTSGQIKMLTKVMVDSIANYRSAIEGAASSSSSALLKAALLSMGSKLAEAGNTLWEAVLNFLNGVGKTINAGGTLLRWLPVIVVALVVGPSLLRTVSSGRKGGASAALDTAAGELESGRNAAGRGVRAAANRLKPGFAGMKSRSKRKSRR